MSQPSQVVADRVAISRTVLESLYGHAPEVAEGLERALFPRGAPSNLSVSQFVHALRDLLARTTEAMTAADAAHIRELADDVAPRALLEQRTEMLKAFLVSLRATLISTYGTNVAAAYAIPARIPEDADGMLSIAIGVERLLRERSLVEAPKIKSLAIAPLAVAEDLAAAVYDVRRALADVNREQREAMMSSSARERALYEWSAMYKATTETVCGLYAIAGHGDLAEGIRPTSRRLSGLPEEEDTAPETERPRTVASSV